MELRPNAEHDRSGYPAPSDAHYVQTGGVALKCSDYLTVPLCPAFARGCHLRADKSRCMAAELTTPFLT